MIYDVEFFYEGRWHFHNQETDLAKAKDWADWLRNRLKVEARVSANDTR
jgi:hypothetical protein